MSLTRQKSFEDKKEGPLEKLLALLDVPQKTHLDVYCEVLRRWLLKSPHNINMGAYDKMANKTGVEPETVQAKIRTLDRSGFIDINCWTIFPQFKLKDDTTEEVFAMALKTYRESIEIEKKKKKIVIRNTNTVWDMMNRICPKTHEYIDFDLCKMARWKECKKCKTYTEKRNKNEEGML